MKPFTLILATAGIILAGASAIELLPNVDGSADTPFIQVSGHHPIEICQPG
ncbi:hypothetical protein [Nocardia australiensis]|uniref:hypothetical protein n=1 Tax=Nocardia australiensis TaxID=2887191 RepID=UPI001D137BDC|nr:hypothetical protein [Nocardia australiensis]